MASISEPEDALEPLERARKEADRLYNDALTALDNALPEQPALPEPPAGFDDQQIHPLNKSWRIVSETDIDLGAGWRRRLRQLVWDLIGPFLQRQERFNGVLVEHVNRNHRGASSSRACVSGVTAALGAHLEALTTFHSRLIQYLQQITLYVDTKDRRELSMVRQSLSAGLDSVTDEFRMRLESATVFDHRMAADMGRLEKRQGEVDKRSVGQRELRQSVDLVTAATHTMKRQLERLGGAAPAPNDRVAAGPPQPIVPDLDAYTYVCFEDSFRGSREEIMAHQRPYLSYFDGASDVVDVGCGRGEFLSVLREGGITARGVDTNVEAVERCREHGLEATRADALGYLRGQADESIGGLFSSQVVEHLEAAYLQQLLNEAHRVLRPDARIVLETINPACWMAFFSAYVRDITHRHPVHPETASYLLRSSGFVEIEVVYRSPLPEAAKLQRVEVDPTIRSTPVGAAVCELAEAFNQHADRLNGLMFAEQDYAAIGRRP